MNPQDSQPQVNNPLNSMQVGERNIFEVKRHPIGMISMYVSVGFMLLVLAVVTFVVAPAVFTDVDKSQVYTYGSLLFLVIGLLSLGFVFISHIVYWGNRWILTSDSLTQVTQRSLFDKQSSQLSLGNLEDVTAAQDGILAHMFHFGVLRVETAGERSKFVFPFCPNPTYYAQQILNAREQFEQDRRPGPSGNQDLNHFATPTEANPNPPVAGYNVPVDANDTPGVNINTQQ